MEKLKSCRICKKKKFKKLFSLGKLAYSGKFTKSKSINIPKERLNLIICSNCKLVQLDRNFDPKYMYSNDYGYRSGINKTMRDHLKSISSELSSFTKLKKNDLVLDIASNDATLLNSYKVKNIIKVGVDPILKKFKKEYLNVDYKISDFFCYDLIKNKIHKKFKIITAISMFYDLPDPNKFLADIEKIIDKKQGIFFLEQADICSIIKNNLFDTICHEHLEYYSFEVIDQMLKKNNLKVINVKRNKINGGSIRFYISHEKSNYKLNIKAIKKIKKEEQLLNLDKVITYKKFFNDIKLIKESLLKKLYILKKNNCKICGYGASTKGNILLQYFGIDSFLIDHIADRNIEKDNSYTPGTKIKIINEAKSRKYKPDYYLVLPWHFKDEIIKREIKMIKNGTRFIFPLPKIQVI